jgi:hypothetical protein
MEHGGRPGKGEGLWAPGQRRRWDPRHGAFSGLGSAEAPVTGWETVFPPQEVQEPDALAK